MCCHVLGLLLSVIVVCGVLVCGVCCRVGVFLVSWCVCCWVVIVVLCGVRVGVLVLL